MKSFIFVGNAKMFGKKKDQFINTRRYTAIAIIKLNELR